MKKYTVKPAEDLGLIAPKFGIPSWRYLYDLNKEKIGENPDLLKPGTVLDMPDLDSTTGDEKLAEKGGVPEMWMGGVSYRYPWVAFSCTMMNKNNEIYAEHDTAGNTRTAFEKKKRFEIRDKKTQSIVISGEVGQADEIEMLVPDCQDAALFIDGIQHGI